MAKDGNIVKFRLRKEVNIGIVIAAFLLIFLIINIYRYFTSSHLSIYEVQAGTAGGEIESVAMVLREEQVVKTTQAGYLNFYFREGSRVAKGMKVYSVNESANVRDLVVSDEETPLLSGNDISHMKTDIRNFFAGYQDTAFAEVSTFHETLLADYLRYRDVSLMPIVSESGTSVGGGFHDVTSESSGLISFFTDRYDGYTVADIDGSEFLEENRAIPERSIYTGRAESDSVAYKLITGDGFTLVFPVAPELLKTLVFNDHTVTFRFGDNGTIYTKPFETFQKDGKDYVSVTMDRYISDFLSKRFVDIVILSDAKNGLKIPKSAILTKELYQVPEAFVMKGGGDGDSLGISLEVFDEKTGAVRPDFQKIDPLFYEDGYYFLSADAFPSECYVYSQSLSSEPERALLYSFRTELEGVYNMNKGYAVFRRIERITDVDDYVLVRDSLEGGVALYDHIILDTKAVTKDVILVEGDEEG